MNVQCFQPHKIGGDELSWGRGGSGSDPLTDLWLWNVSANSDEF